MYKFEISADSPQELQEKMQDFAKDMKLFDRQETGSAPKYLDEIPSASENYPIVQSAFSVPQSQNVQPAVPTPEAAPRIPTARIGLDSRNIPWDERVHASTKEINKDGTWRSRRNVNKDVVKQIETELKANTQVQATVSVVPSIPGIPAFPTSPVLGLPNHAPILQPSPFDPPMQQFPPSPITQMVQEPVKSTYENVQIPPGTRPAHSLLTFKNNLMDILADLVRKEKITPEWIQQMKTHFEVKEIWNIIGNEKQAMELYDNFVNWGFITRVDG